MKLGKIPLRYKKKSLTLCFPWENQDKEKTLKKYNKRHKWKKKDEEKCPKTKSIIEFDPTLSCSVKSLAVKKVK